MDLSSLRSKVERLYEAVASTTESDLTKFPPIVETIGPWIIVRQDFSQGRNQVQLSNAAFQVIRAVAHLKDYLRSAARQQKMDAEEVDRTINGSLPLQLMIDLANLDKHGQHDNVKGQRSKKSPRLVNIRGAMQITTKAGDLAQGGWTGIQLTPEGAKPFGTGKSAVIVTGEIVDEAGKPLLELNFAQMAAVEAWEALLSRLNVSVRL